MNYQFTIQFSEEHIKYACSKYFTRFVGIVFPVICLLVAGFAVARMVSGKADLLAGIFLTIAVVGLGIIAAAYFQSHNYRLSQFGKTGNSVSYELSKDFFKAKSGMGSMELKWESFKAIWIFQKVWLLVFDKNGYLTLPTDQISGDVKEFLKQKIISVGGKVK
jgi:hypothetical protein